MIMDSEPQSTGQKLLCKNTTNIIIKDIVMKSQTVMQLMTEKFKITRMSTMILLMITDSEPQLTGQNLLLNYKEIMVTQKKIKQYQQSHHTLNKNTSTITS